MSAPTADARRWIVVNIGCIECGVSSDVVGCFPTEAEATEIAKVLDAALSWREGGQNNYEVFDLLAPMAEEYAAVITGRPSPDS